MSGRRIVISGASRGIGAALAQAYAAPGIALALIGRDTDRLAGTTSACRSLGAAVDEVAVDVRDRETLGRRLVAFDEAGPVDLVIANAGVALPPGEPGRDLASYDEIDVNLVGALNTVLPLLSAMTERRSGQIAFVSSLAAFAPLPSSPGYSASKAAVLVYGLALRERLRPHGVRVNVVCPGYIDTEMGARYQGWRPLAMSADRAATLIQRGLERDQAIVAFPRRLAAAARLSMLVPEPLRRLGLAAFRFRITGPDRPR